MDESFQFALDWDLLLRFAEAGARIVRLPRFLGAFRTHTEQKTLAWLKTVGEPESQRLRQRVLGRVPHASEIERAVQPYLRRHALCHVLYRLGILRY